MSYQYNSSGTSHNALLGGSSGQNVNPSTRSSSPSHAPPQQTFSIDPGNAQKKPGRHCFQAFCKTTRLHILYSIWGKITKSDVLEEPKIAFYKGRWIALVRSMIHWIPLGAAVVLITFNIMQYYIGGELAGTSGQDTSKLAALQFAAKLHELLMLASIGAATFAYIREEMAFGVGVTIGTVFAGQQFASVNNLWSMEFWSAIYDARSHSKSARKQKWYKISPKWRMVWLITLATVLGVAVGPSGAVLMRPRLDWWPAGGTYFWLNVTFDDIYAEHIGLDNVPDSCSQYSGDMACPYGGFESLLEQYAVLWPYLGSMGAMPKTVWLSGERSIRETNVFQRTSQDDHSGLWKHDITWAHGPFAGIADVIADLTRLWSYAAANAPRKRRFAYRKDASFSVHDRQPCIETFCTPNRVNTTSQTDRYSLWWADTRGSPNILIWDTIFEVMSAYPQGHQMDPGSDLSSWLDNALFNTTTNSVMWLDRPDYLEATNSSLLAIVTLPQTTAGEPLYLSCNMKTSLNPTTSYGTRGSPASITFTGRNGEKAEDLRSTTSRTVIWPTADWAAYTNPYLPEHDMDVFARISAAAGLSNATTATWVYNVPYAVESILSLMIISGLSRMPYRAGMAGTLKRTNDPETEWSGGLWADELLPKDRLDSGGHAFEITPDTEKSVSKFRMHAQVNGYAYSYKGATQIAAIIVLMIYCLLALAHSVASIWKGWSSGAWDTTPELTALALHSDKSDAMHNTGAGIHSIRTMEQRAVVRARNDCVEIIVGPDVRGAQKLQYGQLYH